MENEIKKRGRPKGSKNKIKEVKTEIKEEPKIENKTVELVVTG